MKGASGSPLETEFMARYALLLRTLDAPLVSAWLPAREYRFDATRRRLDFAFPEARVAVELHGATAAGGKYTRPRGIEDALRKANDLMRLNWQLYTYSSLSDLDAAAAEVLDAVQRRAPALSPLEALHSLLASQAKRQTWLAEVAWKSSKNGLQGAIKWHEVGMDICLETDPFCLDFRAKKRMSEFVEYLQALEAALRAQRALDRRLEML